MDVQDVREVVNPVFNTAKSCVQLMAATGDEDAQLLLDALGFEAFGTQMAKKPIPKEMHEQVKRLFPAYAILIETRYRSMNRLVEHKRDCAIVDLPCGYTSRGIRLSRARKVYFGCDLPAVADVMGPAVESIIGSNDTTSYHAVDATNFESLEAAIAKDVGKLLVTTEGLLMYFDQSELEEVFTNIRRLLLKHGGSWVITDRAYYLHDKELVAAALNNDPQLMALYAGVTNRAAASTADVAFNNNIFFDADNETVREFIAKMGFELREVCMADFLPDEISSLKEDARADRAVRAMFKKMMFWELTVAESATSQTVDRNLPFKLVSELKDGVFEASVQGRMDTITAPELLQQFQRAEGNIEAIHLDVSRMSYISSAGLRVLVMMVKSLEDKKEFKMTGASKEVRKILQSTGLDRFLLV